MRSAGERIKLQDHFRMSGAGWLVMWTVLAGVGMVLNEKPSGDVRRAPGCVGIDQAG